MFFIVSIPYTSYEYEYSLLYIVAARKRRRSMSGCSTCFSNIRTQARKLVQTKKSQNNWCFFLFYACFLYIVLGAAFRSVTTLTQTGLQVYIVTVRVAYPGGL